MRTVIWRSDMVTLGLLLAGLWDWFVTGVLLMGVGAGRRGYEFYGKAADKAVSSIARERAYGPF